MSFLFGAGANPANKAPHYTGLQIQTSVMTLPVPVVWGTVKIAPNIIDYMDFEKHKRNNSGGKGAGGKGGSTDEYTATLVMALCEADDTISIPSAFVNQGTSTLGELGFSLIQGSYPNQAPWDYLVEAHPEAAFPYPGTALIVGENYDLGPSPNVPSHNFLVVRTSGFLASWCAPNGIATADMALVIQDLLSSAQYGVPNFASFVDSDTLLSTTDAGTTGDASLQTYLQALGIGMCPALTSQETAQSILNRWLQLTNCAAVWSGNILKFVPYGDTEITGNGVTYLPDMDQAYSLTDADFLAIDGDSPVSFARTSPRDAKNVVILEVTSDDGNYALLPVPAWSQNAIENSNTKNVDSTVAAHEIVGTNVAAIIAQLILQKGLYERNTASLKLPITYCHLDPMELLGLTCPNPGYFGVSFRVTSIEEDDQYDLTLGLDEIRLGVNTASFNAKQGNNGSRVNSLVAPESVNTPLVFEPTADLVGAPEVWIGACGGGGGFDPNWGGAQVHISIDDDNYIHVGDIRQACRMGTLSASLASYGGVNPDGGHTLSVDLSESEGTLTSGASGDASAGRTLCYVDGELLSYETATLASQTATDEAQTIPAVAPYQVNVDHADSFLTNTHVKYSGGATLTAVGSNPAVGEYTVSAGVYGFNGADAGVALQITYTYANSYHYALTNLWRGQFGSTDASHLSGTQFARIDGAVFRYPLPSDYIGETIYIKLVSFNIFNQALEDISGVTAYTYTPSGAGAGGGGGYGGGGGGGGYGGGFIP
jgi:hypothetical protein